MKLYRTPNSVVVEHADRFYKIPALSWDEIVVREDLPAYVSERIRQTQPRDHPPDDLLPPIGNQEVWAAGVTYIRSRNARMEESKSAGGGDFYDRVYHADRPELFFKATPNRVVGPRGKVAIRSDAKWSVPEPELALLVNPAGKIIGYTVGNDMSSRDIEGENPLYLPQAKVYDRSCALGPGILVSSQPLPRSTEVNLQINREGKSVFEGSTSLNSLKRDPETLVEYLYRDNSFPNGCFLLTGTGIVPSDSFSLHHGDEIRISVDGIGTLVNVVG